MLIAKQDSVRAQNILDKHFEVFPPQTTGYDNIVFYLAAAYYRIDDHAKANRYVEDCLKQNNQYLRWGLSLNRNQRASIERELQNNFALLQQALRVFEQYGQKTLFDKYMVDFQSFAMYFQTTG